MNVAQILRQSLSDVDAVNVDSTTDPFFTQTDLLAWANDGKEEMEKVVRRAHADHGLVILQSNDVAYTWGHETFDPSTLQLTAASKLVTLPPDCLILKRIRCITSGYEFTRFVISDLARDDFKSLEGYTNEFPLGDVIYCSIVGERTLYLANMINATLDIELAFISRSLPMQIYSTGTVTILNGAAGVTGVGSAWVASRLYSDLELIVSADANAPKIVSQTTGGTWVDPSTFYYPINTPTGDGACTLLANWPTAGVAGVGHMLATIPPFPREQHHILTKYVAACCYGKQRDWGSRDKKMAEFTNALKDMKPDVQERQEHDVEKVEAWNPYV
jgi:hypothetical protein